MGLHTLTCGRTSGQAGWTTIPTIAGALLMESVTPQRTTLTSTAPETPEARAWKSIQTLAYLFIRKKIERWNSRMSQTNSIKISWIVRRHVNVFQRKNKGKETAHCKPRENFQTNMVCQDCQQPWRQVRDNLEDWMKKEQAFYFPFDLWLELCNFLFPSVSVHINIPLIYWMFWKQLFYSQAWVECQSKQTFNTYLSPTRYQTHINV